LVDAGAHTVYAWVQECLLRHGLQQRQQGIRNAKRGKVLVHHLVGVDFKRYSGRGVSEPGNIAVRRVTVRGSAGAQTTNHVGAQVARRTAFVKVAQWKANGKDAVGEVVGIFKKHWQTERLTASSTTNHQQQPPPHHRHHRCVIYEPVRMRRHRHVRKQPSFGHFEYTTVALCPAQHLPP
jgi:hypothetical protein